jgi:tetratricopeptide (TPR) repeat protein
MSRLGFLGLTVAAWTCLSAPMVQAKTWPGDYADEAGFKVPAHALAECCPQPVWWDQVEGPHIETRKDFQDVWQSKDLSDLQKAKAMFRAIDKKIGVDDEIASLAINYYENVDRDYPEITALKELGVSRYFALNRDQTNYSGEVGDTSAGLVNDLARLYLKADRAEDAAGLIIRLILERGHEINPHLKERASLLMVDALRKQGRQEEAVGVVNYALKTYDGSWEKVLLKTQGELKTDLGWRYYLAAGWLPYLVAILSVFLVISVALYSLRGRQKEQTALRN